jgi:twitching motility protein PilU
VVSQRLLPSTDGRRAAAVEVLLGTPRVRDLIRRGEVEEIKETMEKSEHLGMSTFDGAVYHLYKEGRITLEEAMRNADSQNNLRVRIGQSGDQPAEPKQQREEAPAEPPRETAAPASGKLELGLVGERDNDSPADFSRPEAVA